MLAVLFACPGGDHHHRDVLQARVVAHVMGQLVAVHARHLDIQQHHVGDPVVHDLDRVQAVLGGDDLEVAVFQHARGDAAHGDGIVDDHDQRCALGEIRFGGGAGVLADGGGGEREGRGAGGGGQGQEGGDEGGGGAGREGQSGWVMCSGGDDRIVSPILTRLPNFWAGWGGSKLRAERRDGRPRLRDQRAVLLSCSGLRLRFMEVASPRRSAQRHEKEEALGVTLEKSSSESISQSTSQHSSDQNL